jgi:hypothetical protein
MNLFPSMNQSNTLRDDVNGLPSEPYLPERLSWKEEPSWNSSESSAEQQHGWRDQPHRPRYGNRVPTWWPCRRPQAVNNPDPEQDRIHSSYTQGKLATSYESVQEAGSSQPNQDHQDPSEELGAAMNAAWALAEYGTRHPLTTYPSPPEDKFNATDFAFGQTKFENNTSPRYIIEPISRPTVRVPTINLQPAETYGEGVDFPDLFAGELSNLRQDSTSPALRSRTTESSPSIFENFASPALSAEEFSETPTTDSKPMFVTSQYWDNFESIQLEPTENALYWGRQQTPVTLDQPVSMDNDWSVLSDDYPLFEYQENVSLPLGEPLAGMKNWNDTTLSFSQDTSQALLPPCISQAFQGSDTYFPSAQETILGRNSTGEAPAYMYPDISGPITALMTNDSAQGSSLIPFIETRNSTQHSVTRSERKNFERTRMNTLLVKWKKAGMSYKEIKAKGGFIDAESTLRGRYRTLTKNKEDRVRKPEWQEHDVSYFDIEILCDPN